MLGFERLTNMCGMGCKVFWSPWAQGDKLPYDEVMKDDVTDGAGETDTVTSEPQKPVWADMKIGAPIVRNKSGSVGNIRASSGMYSKVGMTESMPQLNEKAPSVSKLNDSKVNLTSSKEEVHVVAEMVTTV